MKGGGSGKTPGVWDGFKKGETEVDRKQAAGDPDDGRGGGEKDGLLEKDYIAEARQKSERLQACLTQVSGRGFRQLTHTRTHKISDGKKKIKWGRGGF